MSLLAKTSIKQYRKWLIKPAGLYLSKLVLGVGDSSGGGLIREWGLINWCNIFVFKINKQVLIFWALTTGIKWHPYVSQAYIGRVNEKYFIICPTECWISIRPFACRGSYYAFISILFLQFLNVTLTSFKYIKRFKLCSIAFCSQLKTVKRHFSCTAVVIFFSQQRPLLYRKPYPPKEVFHRML